MSAAAIDLLLDAYEAAHRPRGPNPLHHRIEHAIQVTDEQLARLVALDILDGHPPRRRGRLGAVARTSSPRSTATIPARMADWIARWRDFVDAGLHVASATDAPWTFPDFELTDDMGRPVDHIAAGHGRAGPLEPGDLPPFLETSC